MANISKYAAIQQSQSNIDAEVNTQLELAKLNIGQREVSREFTNENLHKLPQLITGTIEIHYLDDKKEPATKQQSRNLTLWTIALQNTIERGYTSYNLVTHTFVNWAKQELKINWPFGKALNIAMLYVKEMQRLHILDTKLRDQLYINDSGEEVKVRVVHLTAKFKQYVGETIDKLRQDASMICKPLLNIPTDWIDSKTGIGTNAKIPLIKSDLNKNKEIDSRVLSAVNKLQNVRYRFNPHVIEIVADTLDSAECSGEQFRLLNQILMLEQDIVSFPVTMDQRGRMYYRGGTIHPQGEDITKASLKFAEYRELGETGYKALCVHTANCWGRSKLSIDNRILFVESNWDKLMRMDTYKKSFSYEAYAATKELQKLQQHIEKGNTKESFQSNLICHQDGVCNGIQHMAAITKNLQTATTVNCTPSTEADKPNDMYAMIAKVALEYSTGDAHMLIRQYGRNMAKKPVMITSYGAGQTTIISKIAEFLKEEGQNVKLAKEIGDAYTKAIEQEARAVKQFTEAMKRRAEMAMYRGKTQFKWATADGFIANTKYEYIEDNRIRAGVFNALMRKQANIDEVKTVGALTPNFIHSLDATHMRLVINEAKWPIAAIHDSIGSHANTFYDTAKIIRDKFVELHKHNNIQSLYENMQVRAPKFSGEYKIDDALESTYLFS